MLIILAYLILIIYKFLIPLRGSMMVLMKDLMSNNQLTLNFERMLVKTNIHQGIV